MTPNVQFYLFYAIFLAKTSFFLYFNWVSYFRKSVICSLPQTQISRFKSETKKEDGGTHHLPPSPSNLDSYSNPFPPPSPLIKSETDDYDASAESSLSARTSGRTSVISISTRYNELNVHNFPAPRPSTIQSCSTFSVQSHRSQQPSPSPVSPLAYNSTVQPPSLSPVSPLAYSSTVQPPSPSPVSPPNQTRNPNDQNISISGIKKIIALPILIILISLQPEVLDILCDEFSRSNSLKYERFTLFQRYILISFFNCGFSVICSHGFI